MRFHFQAGQYSLILLSVSDLRRYIRDFMKKKHITDIRFDELNKSFYSEYLTFAYSEGLKLNTIGDHIKVEPQ